ncbi:hypothetical protein OF83DRAFT_424219 [Amylostereum chailletii]|nr:hypothetical protein OF83DRAFT_424219 [Amylostereum chailletii]
MTLSMGLIQGYGELRMRAPARRFGKSYWDLYTHARRVAITRRSTDRPLPSFPRSLDAFSSLDISMPEYSILLDALADHFLFGDVSVAVYLEGSACRSLLQTLRRASLNITPTNRLICGSFTVATANLRTNHAPYLPT